MQDYRTPGVHVEHVLTEPARVLRTGVPAFLGLIRLQDLKAYNSWMEETSEDPEVADIFLTKPIPDFSEAWIARRRGYVRLPSRPFSPGAETQISDPASADLSFYLRATAVRRPSEQTRRQVVATGGAGGRPESLDQDDAEALRAISAKPQRFTMWPQFELTYGDLRPYGFLTHAVRGFFENQGPLCYVQLIAYQGESPAALHDALRAGLSTLAPYDDYDLVCVPDLLWPGHSTNLSESDLADLQAEVLAHCHQLGDRLVILDSLYRADVSTVLAQRRRITSGIPGVADMARGSTGHSPSAHVRGISGENGALYYPWVRVASGPQQTDGYVPPSGHVAGVYARCDQRTGVHKAPANEVLEGVLELQTVLTDDQQGPLNDDGVNCLRAFPRRGIRVWGARTLSSSGTWRYVNERRVILTAARWIERNMADVVFEPHTPRLWDRITRDLTAYFTDLARRGALSPAPGGEAFYVKCDAETNPREIQEAGMVVTEIGLRSVVPAEFIVIRILHGPAGVQIEQPQTAESRPQSA